MEPLIRVESVLDPTAKQVTVEKLSKRYYLVSANWQLTPAEAVIEVSKADPNGDKRRGE